MEIKNKLTVTRAEGVNRVKKGKGQVKEHEQRAHGHGQRQGVTVGVGDGVGVRNGEKGGTTVTQNQ